MIIVEIDMTNLEDDRLQDLNEQHDYYQKYDDIHDHAGEIFFTFKHTTQIM